MKKKSITELFDQFLNASNRLRTGYRSSLGRGNSANLPKAKLPKSAFLNAIYSSVQGTSYEVKDQKLMDFLPGFLLIHIDEYRSQFERFKKGPAKGHSNLYPFLVNYSSDFYAVKVGESKGDEGIYLVDHEELEPTLIHNDVTSFLETILMNYAKSVYTLDEDHFLSLDFDLESKVAKKLNPGVEFWEQEED